MADFLNKTEIAKEALKDAIEKIKPQVKEIITSSVEDFYGAAPSGSYSRASGLNSLAEIEPSESWGSDSVTLTWIFDSGSVSVNHWESPWGIGYLGSSEHAFTKAFDSGLHGGPRPSSYTDKGDHFELGGWTWARTAQSTPIADLIFEKIGSITI